MYQWYINSISVGPAQATLVAPLRQTSVFTPVRTKILVKIALTPPPHPPCFFDTYKELFLLSQKKCKEKRFIMSKFKQIRCLKSVWIGVTPPPWKMSKSKQKKCLEQFGFGLDPPPFPPFGADFFFVWLPLVLYLLTDPV